MRRTNPPTREKKSNFETVNIKNLNAIFIAALIGLFGAGCSKSTPKQTIHSQPQSINLGVVELANHESHTNSFGDGKDCIVTFTALTNNELMIGVVIETKDSNGKMKRVHGPRLITISGEPCSISDGVNSFTITPKLKTN
jgi:Flp pilus assembly secretin CpaC